MTTNAQNNYILFFLPVNYKRIMNRHARRIDARVDKLASETHGPSCSDYLMAWDFDSPWTKDSSSVCGVCEAYQISTHCEPLYPKCNRISSNKSMNMTPYSPILRRQRHILLTVNAPLWPRWLKISPCVTTKVMWSETAFWQNDISLWQIVHIIKLYIPSITSVALNFSDDFTIFLPVDCAIKSGPRGCGKLTHNWFLH